MKCPICESNNTQSIYNDVLRNGTWGTWTEDKFHVFFCIDCQARFLGINNIDINFYTTNSYITVYSENIDIESLKNIQMKDSLRYFEKIEKESLSGKIIMDIGAASGTFLDLVKPYANRTIAVEPAAIYRDILSSHHDYFTDISKVNTSKEKADIITSFNVIEHVSSSVVFLESINKALKKGGTFYLTTPNYNDILRSLIPDDFNRYFYRTAHLFYFCESSINNLLKKTGFKNIEILGCHHYDLSSLLGWLKDRAPAKPIGYSFMTNGLNKKFISNIEELKESSHLWIKCSN